MKGIFSKFCKLLPRYFMCVYCETGRVLPIYRHGRAPKYRCDHCRVYHTPKAEQAT